MSEIQALLYTEEIDDLRLQQLRDVTIIDSSVGYRSAWIQIQGAPNKIKELQRLPWIIKIDYNAGQQYGVYI